MTRKEVKGFYFRYLQSVRHFQSLCQLIYLVRRITGSDFPDFKQNRTFAATRENDLDFTSTTPR